MIRLEDLKLGMRVNGVEPGQTVTLRDVELYSDAANVIYRRSDGTIGQRLLFRSHESELSLAQIERRWQFDADGAMFRLVSEAYRIQLAHQFDPQLAVHTSDVEPLPHQITAVYKDMLPRKRLRFLLADDPGAGKTIMAGLLIRELMARGDLRRCLICVPGKLSEQWREELMTKFQLEFEILSSASQTSGNPFKRFDLIIVSVDRAKKDAMKTQLRSTRWDLIVCDEAHQMSASVYGRRVEKTQRYRLGEQLRRLTHHFLLMTATPHNGKDNDFRVFLQLLDKQQFGEDSLPRVDIAAQMRRMVKEDLRKFDGRPLYPERMAYTVDYRLSGSERDLYEEVTDYIRTEFARADDMASNARRNVGFALTILQRRLASSPKAIFESLKRRRSRLESQLHNRRKTSSPETSRSSNGPMDEDLQDLLDIEQEEPQAEFINRSTASASVADLQNEIRTLKKLERQAYRLCLSGRDRKWEELCKLFSVPEIRTSSGRQRKLIIFTEYRDTLTYLVDRLRALRLPNEVLAIEGSMPLPRRREAEYRFRNDPGATILVATDAAGEGINLQTAHLMVNYDLPWNPNRLEQRFGRIHRIGQREVCHLWSLVAGETREGMVYKRLLEKMQALSNALDGQVFDILGNSFQEVSLQDLMIDAIRYGDNPDIKAKLDKAIDNSTEKEQVRQLLRKQALVTDSIDVSEIMQLKEDIERASAGHLQPHYVRACFRAAFAHLGGDIRTLQREAGRYAIDHVPAVLRLYARNNNYPVVHDQYRRICFDKTLIRRADSLEAEFIRPGHPLLDATIAQIWAARNDALKRGAILVDERSQCRKARVLFYVEHLIRDAVSTELEYQRAISREVHFLEVDPAGTVRNAGAAPYLDYRPADASGHSRVESILQQEWLSGDNLEEHAITYAIGNLVPAHMERVHSYKIGLLDKTEAAVEELVKEQQAQQIELLRQQKELEEWRDQLSDQREQFEQYDWLQELANQQRFEQLETNGINWIIAHCEEIERREQLEDLDTQEQLWQEFREIRAWCRELDKFEEHRESWLRQVNLLEDRRAGLQQHRENLENERQIMAEKPTVVGAALVIPASVLIAESDTISGWNECHAIQAQAVQVALDVECALKNNPADIRNENRGYDIESCDSEGNLRFILVKGLHVGASTITLTYNETITALNCGNQHILALVEIDEIGDANLTHVKHYPYHEPELSDYCVRIEMSVLREYCQMPA